MKVSKPITLFVPINLYEELNVYLRENAPKFGYKMEYFHYVLHKLSTLSCQTHKQAFVSLNMQKLKAETVSNIGLYLKILRNGEFIIDDGSYEAGVKSLAYKINPKYVSSDVCRIEIEPNTRLYKKVRDELHRSKAHYNRLPQHLRLMQQHFNTIEFDYSAALEWIKNNATDDKKLHYDLSIHHLQDKRFRYFKRNKTNRRLDTNLTNLKSDLKQFLIGEYVSIDLMNSQPFLLSILLQNITNKGDTLCMQLQETVLAGTFGNKRLQKVVKIHQNQEKANMVSLRSFNGCVMKGSLYENFSKTLDLERKEAKNIMFKVLFSKNECRNKFIPYHEDKQKFAAVFPLIYESVKHLKERDNAILPIYLQKLESYLFIDCIAKELVDAEIIPLTIHDSIIVPKNKTKQVLQIVQGVFTRELGVVPLFHLENL